MGAWAMLPSGFAVSHSVMGRSVPAFHLPAGRKYSSPNSQWESAAYETIDEPSTEAPGVIITLVQASALKDAAAAAMASAASTGYAFIGTNLLIFC